MGQGAQPIVAIHDSEFTRALESMPASGATPTGSGYSGEQWYITQWHYFVMPDAVKEALRSDGTAYTVVGDSNILAGVLTNADGSPKYPILISLGSEAIDNGEIAALTNYVAAGGFLFVGGSAFTRNTNGTTRGDFAIASAMGIHPISPTLTNWYFDDTFSVSSNHRLVANIPNGSWPWQMPESSEEISWPVDIHLVGETPNATTPGLPHMIWQVQATNATVIAQGDGGLPYLMVKPYGKGWFIYDAALQPLIGHSGWSPGMYAYSIFRNAIQWAFQSASRPIVKLSPWPYPYDAAVMFRHDMEAIPSNLISINGSAQFEHTNGASGDYYFCTGTLRLDMPTDSNAVITAMQSAISNYGATIYPHNGGLTNVNPYYSQTLGQGLVPVEPNISQLLGEGWLTAFEPYTAPVLAPLVSNGFDYDYWHWSPDEILGTSNLLGGFTNAGNYAFISISNSFNDVAGWHLTNGSPRAWVAPYFNATKEGSYQIEQNLGIQVTGDDKLTPFPHWIFSTQTPDKYYSILSEPVGDWFVNGQVAQSMENGHTVATIQAAVDFYYNLGGLINFYCHSTSDGSGMDGTLPGFYCTYSLSKPRIWSANAARIYSWWLQRSNAQVTASFSTNGVQSIATLAISGNSNTNAAVELVVPSIPYASLQVTTNGVPAGTSVYRTNGTTIKLLVGTSVSSAVVSYILSPTIQNNFYQMQQGNSLLVGAPGVLTNGTTGATAALVGAPANGNLTLNADGSFTYTPTNNYTGVDSFSYQATSGSLTSAVATATIMVTTTGELLYDNFTRPANNNSIFPWVNELGTWGVTNNVMFGSSGFSSYGYAYYNANWTNYSVQAQIQFPSTNAWGGGIAGRLNLATGARYAAWFYPENSPGGSGTGAATMQIIKYESWTAYTSENLIRLPGGMGTSLHTVRLTFLGNTISAYYDGTLITNLVDNGTFDSQPALTSGGVDLELWTQSPTTFNMSVDNVIVSTLTTANNDAYGGPENSTLHVNAPGVLANDSSGGGGTLTALLASGPAHGSLTLTNNGGFSYTPNANYVGTDNFTYKATDGQSTSSVATATITLTSTSSVPPTASNDVYTVLTNSILNLPAPGVLANDTGGSGPLSAVLVSGPTYGSLVLTNNGGFSYQSTSNFTGVDTFTYYATDGQSNSAVATATITVTGLGELFHDNFARQSGSNSIFPWVNERGAWSVTNNIFYGTCSLNDYGYAYYSANWTDYSVQAQFRFPSTNVWGAALGGRLNPATGARYDVWVYPENSPGGLGTGAASLQIIKYETWTVEKDQILIPLPTMGTNWHNLKLAFQGTNVFAYYDGTQITNLVDNGTFDGQPALTNGGIAVSMYASSPVYTISVSNVIVAPLVLNTSFSTRENTPLTIAKPGVLANALDVYGTNLTATPLAGPANGTLNLSTNGGFIYTPSSNFFGTDGFTIQASDKQNSLGTAAVTIAVLPVTNVLAVTVNNTNRLYGATNPVFTVSYSGFVNGDTSSVLSGAPVVSTSATPNSPVATYAITVTAGTFTATNHNYLFSFTNGTLTINPATLTVTASNRSKTYGQTVSFAGTEFSTSGLLNSDAVTGASLSSTGAAAGANVSGSPYSIVVTNAVGTGLTNYTISYVNGTLSVGSVVLGSAANNTNRLYGATNPVFTASYSGFVNGDTVSVLSGAPSLTTNAKTNSPIATYTITNTIGTLSATNYVFSFTNGALTINPATLTVTASNRSKAYGQSLSFAGTEFSTSGLLNSDAVTSASLTSTGAAPGASVSGSPYSIVVANALGTGLTNYAISYVNGTLTVGSAVLGVAANNTNRPYGAINPVFTASYSGFVNGDTASVLSGAPNLTTSATTNSPVAAYVITNVPGSLSATNYTFSFTNGTLTINPAALTVTADNKTRMYGLTNPVLTASYNAFVNNEYTNVLSGSPALNTAAVPGSLVGGYPITITQGTLSNANYSFIFNNGTLTVTSAPTPVILSVGLTNQVVTIMWSSVAGVPYQLQCVTNLIATNWDTVTSNLTATGPTTSQTNAVGNLSQQFYRVTILQGGP